MGDKPNIVKSSDQVLGLLTEFKPSSAATPINTLITPIGTMSTFFTSSTVTIPVTRVFISENMARDMGALHQPVKPNRQQRRKQRG